MKTRAEAIEAIRKLAAEIERDLLHGEPGELEYDFFSDRAVQHLNTAAGELEEGDARRRSRRRGRDAAERLGL